MPVRPPPPYRSDWALDDFNVDRMTMAVCTFAAAVMVNGFRDRHPPTPPSSETLVEFRAAIRAQALALFAEINS